MLFGWLSLLFSPSGLAAYLIVGFAAGIAFNPVAGIAFNPAVTRALILAAGISFSMVGSAFSCTMGFFVRHGFPCRSS